MQALTILVAEDDLLSRMMLERSVVQWGYRLVSAPDGESALDMLQTHSIDICLLDWDMPKMSGLEVCKWLRTSVPNSTAYVILITGRDQPEDIQAGYEAGADDYLTKPFVLAELLARVRALVRRGLHSGNAKLHYADLELDRHRRRATRGKMAVPLTSKEFALLELFLLHAPDLVTRSEIVEHVWDRHFDSETNLVEVYVNRLRQKIDQNRTIKLIHTVRGIGYRLGAVEP